MAQALFIVGNALALLASWRMARWLLPQAPLLERALATCAGVPMLVLPALTVLGALGWLNAAAATCALAVLCALFGWLSLRGQNAVVAPAGDGSTLPAGAAPSRVDALVYCALLAILAAQLLHVCATLVFHGLHPKFDDLSYHGPMAAHWVQAGRLVLAPFSYHAYYPGNGELFAAWFMLPTQLDAYAGACGLFWFSLAALAVANLARELDAGPLGTLLAPVVLLACAPFVEQAATFAAVELGAASLSAAALAFALQLGAQDEARNARARVWYAGMLSGLAIGCKISYAPVALAAMLWFLLARRPRAREAALWSGMFVLAALLGGVYWYGRNLVLTGNPLFPADVFGLDGPLDAGARSSTSLLHQLDRLEGEKLKRAIRELLDWPAQMAWLVLAGVAVSLLAWLWPRFWRQATALRMFWLLSINLVVLAVVVTGPFSGAVNGRGAHIDVRLRFFLLFVLLGIPLLAYWATRVRALAGACALIIAIVAADATGVSAITTALAFLLAIAVAVVNARYPAVRLRWPQYLAPLAMCLLAPALANASMAQRAPLNLRELRKVTPISNAVDDLPPGVRIAWFAKGDTVQLYRATKYYPVFGPGLAHVPVMVADDGSRYVFPHQLWQQSHARWWRSARKLRPPSLDRFVENLQAQHIDYALVLREEQAAWPRPYAALASSKLAKPVKTRDKYALFKLRRARTK